MTGVQTCALPISPQGLPGMDPEHQIEIEVVNPEDATMNVDGMEIDLMPHKDTDGESFGANLAEFIPENYLSQIAGDLIGDFESDVDSRKDWIQTYVDGLELLGLKIEERSEPWEGEWRLPSYPCRSSSKIPIRNNDFHFPSIWPM